MPSADVLIADIIRGLIKSVRCRTRFNVLATKCKLEFSALGAGEHTIGRHGIVLSKK